MRVLCLLFVAVALALVATNTAKSHYQDDWAAGAHCYPPNVYKALHIWGMELHCQHAWEITWGWCWDDSWNAFDGWCYHEWQDEWWWSW